MLQPVFSLTSFFLQIPCGYLSDRWKRGNVLRLGVLFTAIGTVWMYFAADIYQLAFVPLCFGIGFSLTTSSYGAIVYDSLLSVNREDEFPKVIGTINAIGRYALAGSAVVSGFLYNYYIHLPVFMQMFNMIFYGYFTWKIIEPQRHKVMSEHSHMRVILQTMRYVVIKHVDLKWVIVVTCLLAVASTKAYWIVQPLVNEIAPSTIYLGLAAALTFVLMGMASQLTHRIEHLISEKKLLCLAACLSVAGYAASGATSGYVMPLMLCLVFIAFGISQVVTTTMINERVTSDIRATTLSITSSANGLLFSMVTPIFGWMINAVTINFAVLCMSIFIGCIGLVCLLNIKPPQVCISTQKHP